MNCSLCGCGVVLVDCLRRGAPLAVEDGASLLEVIGEKGPPVALAFQAGTWSGTRRLTVELSAALRPGDVADDTRLRAPCAGTVWTAIRLGAVVGGEIFRERQTRQFSRNKWQEQVTILDSQSHISYHVCPLIVLAGCITSL